MSTFILEEEALHEPFKVEYVAQGAKKELIGKINLKHLYDWPESGVDNFMIIMEKFKKLDSLIKKNKTSKPSEKQITESVRISSAISRTLKQFAVMDDASVSVWDSLPLPAKTRIIKAYIEYIEKTAEGTA